MEGLNGRQGMNGACTKVQWACGASYACYGGSSAWGQALSTLLIVLPLTNLSLSVPSHLCSGQMEAGMQRQRRRQERAAAAAQRGGPWLLQLLRRGWLRAGELATDHTRSVLILSVFAFKVSSARWIGR